MYIKRATKKILVYLMYDTSTKTIISYKQLRTTVYNAANPHTPNIPKKL